MFFVTVMFPFRAMQKFPADQDIIHEWDVMAHGVCVAGNCCKEPVEDVALHAAAHVMSTREKPVTEKDVCKQMFLFLSDNCERSVSFAQ